MRRAGGSDRRRSWAQRAFISCNVVALLAAGTTAAALAYGNRRLSTLDRVSVGEALAQEELEEGDPQNILVVGIDDASRLPDGDPVRNRSAGDLAGQRSDTIMVLRLDPRAGTARLLSLPRDLWVPIAGTGTSAKINAAMVEGPSRLIETIDSNFGIPIHHYLQVDMAGFRQLVDIVDGVPVFFPRPARDRDSGLSIEAAGCYTLGPTQALGLARGRYYYVQDDRGRWRQDPRSDLARNERQQFFVQQALSQAIAKGARNPNVLRRLVDLGSGSVTLDELWSPGAAADLAVHFRDFDPEELQTFVLPVDDGREEGSVLHLREEEAEPILAAFRGTGSDGAGRPQDVTVQVLNGTGAQGQGAEVTDALVAAGFEAVVPEDAGEHGEPTTIRYAEGQEADALLVARHLAGPVRYEVDAALAELDRVVLVTGSDWTGVAPTPRPAHQVEGPATTTTTTTPVEPTGEEGGDPEEEPVEVGPGDPAYYQPLAPPPGASCPPTP